ncbi:ribosomal L7Ae/L30e/S12e/Gadd45 family protein [Fodinisporobacter ferrooxydans]|uniref:Ribosomal L7Ae/L30e/S12e/Gadd45 family protein n=1 Tax=Fodinisporobacter ferrooxydans TaxID=2901836 RepID=A0ABY4CG60_9BACL|nr:ribosomal L7Ae/L30e/S12e/Gadd45 family protein [Alicyclobacillaceae bacterium MYW30-H2]
MNHNSNQQKFFQLLGLAMRARSILTGDGTCLQAIRQGQAKAAILAEDAGPNTFKKYHDKCRSYQVPLVVMGDKDTLGQALGKEQRAVIVVTQDGFANRLLELARENNGGDGFDENASL